MQNYIAISTDTTDFNVLLLCGLRACLGSGSYAPGCAIDFFTKNWSVLPESVKKNAARDLLKWLGEQHFQTNDKKMYWAQWYSLMTFIKAESPDVCKWAAGSNLCNQAQMVGVDEFFGSAS